MNPTQRKILLAVFGAALALRLLSLPATAFFGDVPANQAAVESGAMIIQFPGYAPYHLLARAVSVLTGGVFAALILISLAAGLGAMGYVTRFAADRSGFAGALPAAVIMGFGVLPLYFSVVGASYALDMLAAAALLWHGHRFLRHARPGDYYAALGAVLAGSLMRPLSCGFLGLGIVYLLARRFSPARAVTTALLVLAAAGLGLALTLPYYGSFAALMASTGQVRAELQPLTLTSLTANLVRLCLYPLWGFHLLLGLAMLTFWRRRHAAWDRPGGISDALPVSQRPCAAGGGILAPAPQGGREQRIGDAPDRPLGIFLLLTFLPYFIMLMRYVPHAGYYALLIPGIVALPWVAGSPCGVGVRPLTGALILAALFSIQWWGVRPVATRGPVALVANVYMLQYSHAGIRMGLFETLASLSLKTGVWAERIPEARRARVLNTGARERDP